jgi:pimeloyl-ACP methyl ester carboxylesterase
MADDVAGLFGTLGVASAGVVGYSMGGKIALHLAACHAELVDHLVLCATAPRPPVTRRFSRRWFMMDLVPRTPKMCKADGQPVLCLRGAAAGVNVLRRPRAAPPG